MGTCIPPENDIVYIRTSKRLRNLLTPTEAEEAEYNFQSVTAPDGRNMVVWEKHLQDKEAEIPFTPRAFEMVRKELKKLNESGKLTEAHETLWDKFDMDKE